MENKGSIYEAPITENGVMIETRLVKKILEGENGEAVLKRVVENLEADALKQVLADEKKEEGEKVGGLTPCSECGGTDFLRTGTCHACITCGTSQGCS